jgi:predicted MPP superfamily phosphohydrolase
LGAGSALIAWPALGQTAWTIQGSEHGVLRLLFYTDVHARPEWETPTALMMAADAINAQKGDLVLGGGDLIDGGFGSTSGEGTLRWNDYMAMHRAIDGEHHAVIGNHDLVGARPKDGSPPAADPRL